MFYYRIEIPSTPPLDTYILIIMQNKHDVQDQLYGPAIMYAQKMICSDDDDETLDSRIEEAVKQFDRRVNVAGVIQDQESAPIQDALRTSLGLCG